MAGPRPIPNGRAERSAARRRSTALRHHLGMGGPPAWVINVIFIVTALIVASAGICLIFAVAH